MNQTHGQKAILPILVLFGTAEVIRTALATKLVPAGKLTELSAPDNKVIKVSWINPALEASEDDIDLELEASDAPGISDAIAIPGNYDGTAYLVVEDDKLTDSEAEMLAIAIPALYDESGRKVANTEYGKVQMPSHAASTDRLRLISSDGSSQIINLDEVLDEEKRLTIGIATATENNSLDEVIVGVEGYTKLYGYDGAKLAAYTNGDKIEAKSEIELPAPLARIGKANAKGLTPAYLENGDTVMLQLTADGLTIVDHIKLISDEEGYDASPDGTTSDEQVDNPAVDAGTHHAQGSSPSDADDTVDIDKAWELMGLSDAVLDTSGQPTVAFTKPGTSGVELRFRPASHVSGRITGMEAAA